MFIEIKDTKKTIERLKKVCTAMTKFNLNSPCLLQFIRDPKGDLHFILTHDPSNGSIYDYKDVIYQAAEYRDIILNEDEEKCFSEPDERICVPIVISSIDISPNKRMDKEEIQEYYNNYICDYGNDSLIIYPKFVLKAIKENIITSFQYKYIEEYNNKKVFALSIQYKPIGNYMDLLFTHYDTFIEKTKHNYNLKILPFEKDNWLNSIFKEITLNTTNSFVTLEKDEWEKIFTDNQYMNAVILKGYNQHEFIIYHHDFVPKKIQSGYISKIYFPENSNKVRLSLKIELNHGIFEYFMYRYCEM